MTKFRINTVRRAFARELRRLGFARIYPNDRDPMQFECIRGDRFLTVQLWKGGLNRVSHGSIIDGNPHRRRETTTPTTFDDVPAMLAAIEFEWKRPSGPGISTRAGAINEGDGSHVDVGAL